MILLAIGRQPNTAGFGLERAGVAVDTTGAIDRRRISRAPTSTTSMPIGDVTNRIQLTPVAIREGMAVAENAVRRPADHASTTTTSRPRVFSQPEVGTVGLTEEEARRALSLGRHLPVDLQAAAATASPGATSA